MAYIQNTAFELKVSNHEFDSTTNITGIFGAVADGTFTPAVCSAGFLCTKNALTQNEGYPQGVLNGNTWQMVAATSAAVLGTGIYAANPFNVNMITDPVTGAKYKVGHNTLGLPIPEGERDTFTRIDFLPGDRHYRFGIGNVAGELGANGFLTIDAGKLKPAAAAPTTAGALYFKVLGTGAFTQGANAAFGYVDVEAHANVVAAG